MSRKNVTLLCIASFLVGLLISGRVGFLQPLKKEKNFSINHGSKVSLFANDCEHNKRRLGETGPSDVINEVSKTHQVIQSLDKAVSSLEMELAAARVSKNGGNYKNAPQKAFVVIGINTAFSSRKRRESLRETWVPRGSKLKKLEKEKGIVIRFVIGHSATKGSVLDRAIDLEEAETKDFLRLNHVEGYHELSTKTRVYFATAVAMWDADFYVKVDDDVHVNLGVFATRLAQHRTKPHIYIGCMKSGPVLSQKGVKYHEPEYWKFGDEGNRYFRHATGQIYAISKDLAAYISINLPILHRYANEDVSLGAWLIGLEVEHIDDRSMCCGTPPDCEWKAQAGNLCAASFDWSCSGICKSVERMKEVHGMCGEGENALPALFFLFVLLFPTPALLSAAQVESGEAKQGPPRPSPPHRTPPPLCPPSSSTPPNPSQLLVALMEISSSAIVVERASSLHGKGWRVRGNCGTVAATFGHFAATEFPLMRVLLPNEEILRSLERLQA
ncbi:hypothetical protein LUZ60_001832 [Juncus effusus]|nr:hypothetical protein LUZ60_001832 [Juncus effusus]